ncbi:probable LRR receptor-like serine/threonine-protein kinase At3g47570 [Telopea speciosissima]|uniref:probable LRR receptor-like serine/threonine-protein kinase At3g47570 n=1 Tax=Telopea speciosissima TaxID=54955 RepID=UPI001CC52F3A|nr:probable LRR receptor-like serine/threonine-protein kinase At3g47570 [Telopea speciosissima]
MLSGPTEIFLMVMLISLSNRATTTSSSHRLCDSSIVLDLFACPLDQVGAAELKVPVESSGGGYLAGMDVQPTEYDCIRTEESGVSKLQDEKRDLNNEGFENQNNNVEKPKMPILSLKVLTRIVLYLEEVTMGVSLASKIPESMKKLNLEDSGNVGVSEKSNDANPHPKAYDNNFAFGGGKSTGDFSVSSSATTLPDEEEGEEEGEEGGGEGTVVIGNYMSLANSQLEGSNATDRVALLAIKSRITNDPFHVFSSWNDSVPYCEWPGVICDDSNRVSALGLQSNGLVGSVAPEIGNLSFLQEISLQNNSFYGEIPHEVSFLSRLRYLLISYNSFEGEIPPNISQCSNLIELSLGSNNIVGKIPVELGTLSKLQLLSFHYNRLIGQIPYSFENLSSLQTISAASNALSGRIPDAFGQMTSLKFLSLFGNKFSGTIPPTIYNLSLLSIFDVGSNQLQGSLPSNLGFSLPNLWWFSISANQFHGSIPISVSNLSKLQKLFVGENNLTGKVAIHFGGLSKLSWLSLDSNHLGSGEADDLDFVNTLINCSNLTVLNLGDNRFGGVLPNSIANLSTQLTKLLLAKNQIFGEIPVEIGNLVSLQLLSLSDNLLEGTIPNSIGRLQMLNRLELYGNRFTGSIPYSLGNLTLLIELYLGENLLQGKIPSSLGKCKDLLRLGLSGNRFNGIIPRDIFDIFTLIELNLSRNSFFGSIPSEVGRLTNLEIFDVSENMLFGDIPSTLGACISLEHIFMGVNLFQGSIPLSLSSLRGLQGLDLSYNNFSGFIPKFLGTLTFLQKLNLSFNQLEGEVPVDGVFGNSSTVQVIGNNKLCGVKVLDINQRVDSKSFMVECESLRNISHHNLVKFLTSCSSVDFEGNDFKALVSLDYLHHHCHTQIIHCNLKPSNILLDNDLTAHLGDFGISRILSKATQNYTSSIGIKGSIGYIAPEYGVGAAVSTHGDVYSYGILLLEMFTGKRPTHEMFEDNFNLHCWGKMALRDRVMAIIDPSLLLVEEYEEKAAKTVANTTGSRGYMKDRVRECLNSIIRIGVSCSAESPWDRMNINDVVKELHLIKDVYLGVGTH